MQKAEERITGNKLPAKRLPVTYAFSYINADVTRLNYSGRLKVFFDYLGLQGNLDEQGQAFLDQARQDDDSWAAEQIQSFMQLQRERVLVKKELASGTARNFLKPIKAFLEFYDDVYNKVPWKRIQRSLPHAKQYSSDRAPTIEEIRKLIEYPDRRIKPIVYIMCSSGVRVGSWDFMRWKDISPIYNPKNDKEVIAAKLKVYAGEPESYDTLISPEAFQAVKDWMDFRASYGERISPESPVLRDMFATTDIKRRKSRNDNFYATVKNPTRLSSGSVKRILVRAFYEQGLRDDLQEGERRHEFKGAHGFRKFYKTRAEQVMNRLNVEFLMGHSIGLNSNYYRPTQEELLADFIKAVPALTINEDITNIKKQQENLEKRDETKDKEIASLSKRLEVIEQALRKMIASEADLDPRLPKERRKIEDAVERATSTTTNGGTDYFGPQQCPKRSKNSMYS